MQEFDLYPEKPDLIEYAPKSSLGVTLFSLIVFIMVFLLLFEDQLLFLANLLIVLVIHELGHFIAMKYFKYENVRMLFIPLMGAFVQGKKSNCSQKQSLWVLIAGPFPGIIIGNLLFWYSTWSPYYNWLAEPALLFILLNLINLLPLDPLDGGQMFKLLVKRVNEFLLMIFALVSSLILIGIGAYWRNPFIIVFGFLMAFRVRALQKKYQMHRELAGESVNYATTYKSLTNKEFSKIKDVLLEHTPALKKFIDHVSSEEADPILASQVNNVLVTPIDRDTSLFFRFLVILAWVVSFLSPWLLSLALGIKWWGSESI
jgi:stage IV sporulation protein FB